MATAVRTTCVAGAISVTNSEPGTTLYTVPAGRTLIVRAMCFIVGNAVATDVLLRINSGSGDVGFMRFNGIPALSDRYDDRWFVLEENWALKALRVAATSNVRASVFGVLLPGPSA